MNKRQRKKFQKKFYCKKWSNALRKIRKNMFIPRSILVKVNWRDILDKDPSDTKLYRSQSVTITIPKSRRK